MSHYERINLFFVTFMRILKERCNHRQLFD